LPLIENRCLLDIVAATNEMVDCNLCFS